MATHPSIQARFGFNDQVFLLATQVFLLATQKLTFALDYLICFRLLGNTILTNYWNLTTVALKSKSLKSLKALYG